MSQDVAARLAALSQDRREGRLTVSAYRSLRAPLLDKLVTPEPSTGAEEADPSTTTRPRHRPPAVGAAGSAAGNAAGGEPIGLLAPADSLVEASALARTNLQAAAHAEQAERGHRLRPMVVGAVLLAVGVGLMAAGMAWFRHEPAPPSVKMVSPAGVESSVPARAPDRTLTPMPPPLPGETKRKSVPPPATAAASADLVGCEPQARAASVAATPCRDRLSATELGPRMLLLPGPATTGVVFAISARPVSQAQFRLFCQRTSRPYPRQPWSEDDDPVVNVTWNEARDYLAWLSSTTGNRYRLATETEWLYFVSQVKVDARWRNGNVREWLQDAADDSASNAEPDAADADAIDVVSTAFDAVVGHEPGRIVRGVSYADAATDLLSARRARDASMRDAVTGFRALRETSQ